MITFYKSNKFTQDVENCSRKNFHNILKEFYKRFVIPTYIILLSLIPFIMIIFSKENLNYQKVRLFTFLIGFSVIIFSETTIKYISNSLMKNIGLSLIPMALVISIYVFFYFKFKTNLKNSKI